MVYKWGKTMFYDKWEMQLASFFVLSGPFLVLGNIGNQSQCAYVWVGGRGVAHPFEAGSTRGSLSVDVKLAKLSTVESVV